MATYFETKAVLDEIAAKTLTEKKRLDQAKALVAASLASLTSMTTQYSGFVTQLNADAAASPADSAWQLAKSEKDLLVAEFQALKSAAESLNTAVGN